MGARCLCFAFFFVCLLCFVSYYPVIIFQRAEKTTGDAKKANEERNRRTRHVFAHQPLEYHHYCSQFDVSQCVGNRIYLKSIPDLVNRFSRS